MMRTQKYFIIAGALCIASLWTGCRQEKAMMQDKETIPMITELQKKYAPDHRTAIFDVAIREQGGAVIVKGEVGEKAAKDELMRKADSAYGNVVDSVTVLPEESLGTRTFGIIIVSVANMRSDPREGAELASQALMGTIVKVWKRKRGYYYIQTPDGYLGWTDSDQLIRVSRKKADEWKNTKKVFVTELYDFVRQEPDRASYPVCDVTGGAVLKDNGTKGEWVHVFLPDERNGYIRKSSVMNDADWGTKLRPVPDKIERTAKFLMGVPYLWGGTSVKGVDCSGFTKTVFLLNGQLLNRDANQQAEQGIPVEPGKEFENLHKGDLLFFGKKATDEAPEKIVHVAIYLGNNLFIHSSGKVRISSFEKHSQYYDEYNLKRFVRARRVIAESPTMKEVSLH